MVKKSIQKGEMIISEKETLTEERETLIQREMLMVVKDKESLMVQEHIQADWVVY